MIFKNKKVFRATNCFTKFFQVTVLYLGENNIQLTNSSLDGLNLTNKL